MQYVTASSTVNVNRDTEMHPEPILLPAPWSTKSEREEVSDEELDAAIAALEESSAIPRE